MKEEVLKKVKNLSRLIREIESLYIELEWMVLWVTIGVNPLSSKICITFS